MLAIPSVNLFTGPLLFSYKGYFFKGDDISYKRSSNVEQIAYFWKGKLNKKSTFGEFTEVALLIYPFMKVRKCGFYSVAYQQVVNTLAKLLELSVFCRNIFLMHFWKLVMKKRVRFKSEQNKLVFYQSLKLTDRKEPILEQQNKDW